MGGYTSLNKIGEQLLLLTNTPATKKTGEKREDRLAVWER